MTKERLFKRQYAQGLLAVARGDLESAILLYKGNVSRKENIFFHLQQCVEKSLKATICWRQQPVPLVHDLAVIMERLKGEVVPHAEDLIDWGQFATIRRYEEGVAIFSEAEISGAIAIATEILAWSTKACAGP